MSKDKRVRFGIVLLAIAAFVLGSASTAFAATPSNDDFADATEISSVPFSDTVDTREASFEDGEPMPCGFSVNTAWWVFTAPTSELFAAKLDMPYTWIAAYTGNALTNLNQLAANCFSYNSAVTFHADAGTTVYIQVLNANELSTLTLDVAPQPTADFYYNPGDPSTFDTVEFYDNSWDPIGFGIVSQSWDFGDGATATGYAAAHKYAAVGDYTVQLAITTSDGRTASTSKVVHVANHDVSIARFSVPKTGRVNQKGRIAVSVTSKLAAEMVRIDLYKSLPGGDDQFELIGMQQLLVPARLSNRAVIVNFSYTFTSDDARVGKVTFKAVAAVVDGHDALPGDNEMRATTTVLR